jgi:PAS domain S-box-containing protein
VPSLSAQTRASLAIAGVTLVILALVSVLAPADRRASLAAILAGVAIFVIALRFAVYLRAERRYAGLLESEVATQTRSLMDALAAAAAAERSLRLVMDAVPDAIVVLDRDGHIVDSNQPAQALARSAAGERTIFDTVDEAAAGRMREKMAAAFHGALQRFEITYAREDGAQGTRAVLYAPVRDGAGISRVIALVRDVTDQKRADAQFQQAEKLAAMGQLVSGVAHEINNPAAIISGFAQTLLLDELKPDHREMLQAVYDEATRIGRITSNLLAFARAGGKQRTLVDLNDLVRRTFALRSYYLSTLNIAVSLALDLTEPKIWADPSELQQLILNLLINAEQALVTVPGPRVITVRTRSEEHSVRLELADTGPGIPAEIQDKIFDPFFTTKDQGLGTGLGLSICYGIAQDHGGRITVHSAPGEGATFSIALPRDRRDEARAFVSPAPAPAAPDTAAAPGAAPGARLTVLVVDDESALRNALVRYLGRRGISAEGAEDGAAALRILSERNFDVIISDVRMPGMSGREFLEELRRDRPELVARLVFSSGDALAADTAALIQDAARPTVTKPFDFAALERVIREVATAAASGSGAASAKPRLSA